MGNVLASLIDVGQTRLELLTLELQAEVRRAAGLLALGFFTLFFAGMGCLLAGLSLIFAFWDSDRILVSVLVTGFFFLLASLGGWKLSGQLRRKPPMLGDTLSELRKDSDRLRSGMGNGA
ncbi:MAG: phage holin family protein [Gammaproteobacteria bacterium]|nr:phage holin family protein [Gammaproteobacteria bacterium]